MAKRGSETQEQMHFVIVFMRDNTNRHANESQVSSQLKLSLAVRLTYIAMLIFCNISYIIFLKFQQISANSYLISADVFYGGHTQAQSLSGKDA